MKDIFSSEFKIIAERDLWIAVAKSQKKLGHKITDEQIEAYEKNKKNVDLESIDKREKITRHDVMARIEEFNKLAGHEIIHTGMTSRDLTENVEALQIRLALDLIHDKVIALLSKLGDKANQFLEQPIVGRSHNIPAQITTLGKRFASCAEELLYSFERLNSFKDRYPMRGIRGPVGTSQDSIEIVGSYENHLILEEQIAQHLGFTRILDSTGQIYPRSLDYELITNLVQIASAPSSLATSIRLMAGSELVTEGFKQGQVGSSAMPHKMNTRSCERINGLHVVLKGYSSMVSDLSGSQWNEGDVSCSVVRRVAIPEAFFAVDGLIETMLTVLNEFSVFTEQINLEIQKLLPLLASTRILIAAVKKGCGREDAHKAILEHSIEAVLQMRQGKPNSMIDAISKDPRIPLDKQELEDLIDNLEDFTGAAQDQTIKVIEKINRIVSENKEAARYEPHPIK